nr:hypothetical protein [Acuticoccus kalidii]
MFGSPGPDEFLGFAGNDLMRGRGGDDAMFGGYGNDTLIGDDGDDWLNGGPRNDVLIGGEGADTFVFDSRAGLDVVKDFESGDRILIDASRDSDFAGATIDDVSIVEMRGSEWVVVFDQPVVKVYGEAVDYSDIIFV